MKKARLKVSRPAVLCVLAITGMMMIFGAVVYQRQVQAQPFEDLDTPIVLIGGSVTGKRALKNDNNFWEPITAGQEYHAVSSTAVAAIAIKVKADDDTDFAHRTDDGNSKTDQPGKKILTGGQAWRITVFTTLSPGGALLIASTNGTDIHLSKLDPTGVLCPKPDIQKIRKIDYGHNAACDNDQLIRVVVEVNGQQPKPITCQAATSANPNPRLNKCRIVLRVVH